MLLSSQYQRIFHIRNKQEREGEEKETENGVNRKMKDRSERDKREGGGERRSGEGSGERGG